MTKQTKHGHLIKLLSSLSTYEIRDIRLSLKRSGERELLQAFDLLIDHLRHGKLSESEISILKNHFKTSSPYSIAHKLKQFILNRLAFVMLKTHKTHKLFLQLLHYLILHKKGLRYNAKQIEDYLVNKALLIGHSGLMASLALYISIHSPISSNIDRIKLLWKNALENQIAILKSSFLFEQLYGNVKGKFIKRDMSNLSSRDKKILKALLRIPIPKGYLPAYTVLLKKHDVLFYILSRFERSQKLLPALNSLSSGFSSIYQPEVRVAALIRLIRHTILLAEPEELDKLLKEAEAINKNPFLNPLWKTNLITKVPYKFQVRGDINQANATIKKFLKHYNTVIDSAVTTRDFLGINNYLELMFLRINNNLLSGNKKPFISRDLNIIMRTFSNLKPGEYDSFFDILYLICRSVHHKTEYWFRQLRKKATDNQPLGDFANLLITWTKDNNKYAKQDDYLNALKQQVYEVPGIGHILAILNIPGWMLRGTFDPTDAERTGRILTRKFLGL